MKKVRRTRAAAVAGALLLIFAQGAVCRAQVSAGSRYKEAIVVELRIEGFMDFTPVEVPVGRGRDAGVGVGGGGGVSNPTDVAGYTYGMSVVKWGKRDVTAHIKLTLRYVDGSEKSIDEQFLVVRGQQKEYGFAYGVRIKARFKRGKTRPKL